MPEEEDVEQIEGQIRSARSTLPEGLVSRVIEYFPPGENMVTARDCKYQGQTYSKGAVITMPTVGGIPGVYECSGDRHGAWKPQKQEKS